jgi:anti-anti-sigma factor
MQINFTDADGYKRVVLVGRMDAVGVEQIEAQFSGGVVAGGGNTIVDLAEVDFLASLGVRMLISTARALSARGGRLVMVNAVPAVADTIEIMAFDDIVPLAASEPDAVALLRG